MAKAEIEILLRGKTPEEWAKYDAVIEAAEAWTREHYPEQYDALHQAVCALQVARDGD